MEHYSAYIKVNTIVRQRKEKIWNAKWFTIMADKSPI